MLYSDQTLELHSKKEKFPMKDLGKHICRIAVVQAEPVLFNKQESLKKTLCYIEEVPGTVHPGVSLWDELRVQCREKDGTRQGRLEEIL